MNLGRLLAAGKSLIGLNHGESRYREDKSMRLPKFISPKNPFTPPAENPPVLVVAPAPAPPENAKAETKEKPLATEPATPREPKPGTWFGGLGAKLNPFTGKGHSVSPARSLTLHQTELSLDRVKVMRNDLRDADAEMSSSMTGRSSSPVMALTAETLEPVGAAWNWVATRFLGEDQTR